MSFFSSVIEPPARGVNFFSQSFEISFFLMATESEQKGYPGVSFQGDDEQRVKGLQVFAFFCRNC